MDQSKIGQFITDNRKNLGMTQKELAEKVGVSDKTISKWECGNGLPEITLLKPLCDALEINVNELLSGERLPDNIYPLKAEENIMSLMIENENTKKGNRIQYVMGVVLAILALLLLFFSITGNNINMVTYFIDIPSALILLLLCGAGILLSGKKTVDGILDVLQRIVIPAGFMIALFEFVVVAIQLDSVSVLGPCLAICVLSPFYALVVYFITAIIKAHR